MRYGLKWPTYAKQWNAMKINAARVPEFNGIANKILANKARYVTIEKLTGALTTDPRDGVPWYMIAVLHMRESSGNFSTYLGNGQPLNRKTTIVPKGRGPFTGPDAFEKGALDALRLDGLAGVIDWRLEKILWWCESYNGLGYENKGLPSPYVWGGTNQQKPGKYIRDGVFSKTVWDTQPGCAPILATLAKLDPTIKFIRES